MHEMGWFGIVTGHSWSMENSTIQWSVYKFLLAFHSNYYISLSCTVCEI